MAIRWYLRYGLSYRDIEELLAERGIEVDHVTIVRWVQRFTRCRPTPPGSPATRPLIDGSPTGRDGEAARRFFQRALASLKVVFTEVVPDAAPVYRAVLDELIPCA